MNINLITEEEVHLILTSLPQLKKLNGKEIKITEERDINGIVDLDNEDIKNISFRNINFHGVERCILSYRKTRKD